MNEFDKKLRTAPTQIPGFHDCRITDAMPLELLRDGRGVYGIGVSGDIEALAIACAHSVEGAHTVETPQPLILRPDRFQHLRRGRLCTAALQKVARNSAFRYTTEEALRKFIHREALRRAGLSYPSDLRWWSGDKERQTENRRIFHGLRQLSLGLVNRLIGSLIEMAADPDAIRAARRFTLSYREDIYQCAALSRRALQLTETFPVLALALYSSRRLISERVDPRAAILVERGARLRDVAAALEIPMALRHVKPGVAHLVTPFLIQHPDLLQWMPRETPAARIWVTVVCSAGRHDADVSRWVARHVSEIPGRFQQVDHTISDVLDWVQAHNGVGRQFVTRSFSPSMALSTAIQASHAWHETVAKHIDADDRFLPPPWFPPAKERGFDFVPLATGADLYREGHAMHHCVATYVEQVRQGRCSVFSIRRDGKRIATISLICDGEIVSIRQLRGPCNAAPPKAVVTAVRQWLSAQRTTAAVIKQKYGEWCATKIKYR